MSDRNHYQASFVGDDGLRAADFLASPGEAEALRKIMQDTLRDTVSDIQVYEPILDDAPGPLGELLGDIESASRKHGGARHDALRAKAKAFEVMSGDREIISVDFVWNNGGREDNAFSSSFSAPLGTDLRTLARELGEAFQGSLYDVQVTRRADRAILPDAWSAALAIGLTEEAVETLRITQEAPALPSRR